MDSDQDIIEAERKAMKGTLERCQALFRKALPQFNWGASALDAETIRLLNEVPGEVDRVLTPWWLTS